MVTTLHGTDITLVGRQPSYRPLLRYALETSHAVTAVSEDLAMRSVDSFYPRSDGSGPPVEVIPNFVNAEEFRPLEGPAYSGPPRAIHVSNFRPVKRVPWLVEAFIEASEGSGARLVILGDGPDRDRAEALARELGAEERISFLGQRDVLPSLLTAADLFLLASTEESFGLSALEAMAWVLTLVLLPGFAERHGEAIGVVKHPLGRQTIRIRQRHHGTFTAQQITEWEACGLRCSAVAPWRPARRT